MNFSLFIIGFTSTIRIIKEEFTRFTTVVTTGMLAAIVVIKVTIVIAVARREVVTITRWGSFLKR